MGRKRAAKMGRPPAKDPRIVLMALRLTKAESRQVRAQARKAGVTLTEWIRRRLLGGNVDED